MPYKPTTPADPNWTEEEFWRWTFGLQEAKDKNGNTIYILPDGLTKAEVNHEIDNAVANGVSPRISTENLFYRYEVENTLPPKRKKVHLGFHKEDPLGFIKEDLPEVVKSALLLGGPEMFGDEDQYVCSIYEVGSEKPLQVCRNQTKERAARDAKWLCSRAEWDIVTEPYALWKELGIVPVDNSGKIQEPFYAFPVGTDREDIWHWFEKVFDVPVHILMHGKE